MSLRLRSSVFLAVLAALGVSASAALAVSPPSYILQWGTFGSGPGQFKDVSGVAVDGSGNVYTIETVNNRVQKFTSTGVFITQWGTAGSGNGQFQGPYGITVSGSDVFVVDTGNNRVQKFTTAGAYVSQFGTTGSGNGQFTQPLCCAVDLSGNIYVTDYALHRVQKFTSAGVYVTQWGTFGTGFGTFNGPAGIVVDGFGYVYVTDSGNHSVQGFTPSGGWITQWGSFGTGNGQYNYPFGITTNGADMFVVDTINNRMQVETAFGTYLTQWGTAGSGNGQFNDPHNAAFDIPNNVIYVADTANNRIQKFGYPPSEECALCVSPPDTCCEALPRVGGPWTNVVVGTRQPNPSGSPYSVTLFNLLSSPTPTEDTDWPSMTRYNGPGNSWNGDSLGTVFGLTLDEYGNIFVTHTSCYGGDLIGQVFNAGPGAVYRIDGTTGKITTFVKLPNFPDGSVSPPEDMPGLGNITYDCNHKQFFVTNIEDGKIYRIQPVGVNGPTGTVVQTFDPLTPDNGLAGFAPIGERLWGVQWHANRVFYSVWAQDMSEGAGPNEIRSVALLPSGAFNTSSDQHELFLPTLNSQVFSMPVSDISFSTNGKMLLAERGISGKSYPAPHAARLLEYACSGGCWVPANHYRVGACCGQDNSAGGCDYDRMPFTGSASTIGRVWASGDALHLGTPYPDVIYGYQGLRPNLPFGSNLTSMLIDSDGLIVDPDKTFIGDVEAPGCVAVTTGAICGQKYYDLNRNGVKDGAESGLSNWTITANGPGGPYTAVTDANGNYCFTNLPPGNYTLYEIGQPYWVQTGPPGGTYSVSVAAGQTLYLKDFGNYACAGVGGGCVQPPPMMVAWWPFNEPLASTTASDVTHMSPARNVAQLFGGASISASGMVQRALCFPNETAYARVPNSNQLGTSFGAGPFAIDAWVNPNAGGGNGRTIVEKRRLISPSPYKTLGWALYMNGQQLFLELGTGVVTQIVPGPTIPAATWSHIAVSVDRSPAAGRWYVNGAVQGAFNFVPTSGPVTSTADIYMGQMNPAFGVGTGFNGCIDELELLNTANPSTPILPASTVAAIYAAGGLGKCPDYVSLPSLTTICQNQTSVTVCFSICNNSALPQTYSWSLAGLPIGPGCTVAGPTVFNPPAGSVTVSPGCSGPICVTIPRPPGLTAQGATSCFAMTFINNATGACSVKNSTIKADNSCWCVTPPPNPVPVLAGPSGVTISIGVGRPCDTAGTLSYVLRPVWTGTDHPDPMELRLNGLPPGEPVIGTLSIGPNGTGQISVDASFPNGYDMEGRKYEIVLEADMDGDGQYEPVASVSLRSTYDESGTVSVPAPPVSNENLQLTMAPNPFLGGSAMQFRLSQADDVQLGVYDLSGRQVRSLQSGRLAAGEHRIAWNGRDEHGRKVAAGVYFVRLDATGRHVEAKLVKLQ